MNNRWELGYCVHWLYFFTSTVKLCLLNFSFSDACQKICFFTGDLKWQNNNYLNYNYILKVINYLTTFFSLQVQFFLMILYLLLTPLMSSCRSSNLFILTLVINNLLFVYLFSNFYVKEYLKSRQSEKNINKSTPGVINRSDISHYKLMDKKFT